MSLFVLNFVPNPARAAAEMRRVTRVGGTVAAAVWDYDAGMTMLRAFWDAAAELDPEARARDERGMPLCRSGELAQLLRAADLRDVEEHELHVEQRFESFDDYWAPFELGTGPAGAYVAGLDPDRADALRSRLRQRLGEGPLALDARAWAARGVV